MPLHCATFFQVLLQFSGLFLTVRAFSRPGVLCRLPVSARRFWALAAALLVLWAAVHPALLNAAAGERVLLCTAQGMEWVAVAGEAQDGAPFQPLAQSAPAGCPWCVFMQLLLPAPPAPVGALARASAARLVRVLTAPAWRPPVEAARHLRALPGRGPPL